MDEILLFENIPGILFIVDKKGLIKNLNVSAKDFLGTNDKDTSSKNFFDFIESDIKIISRIFEESHHITFPQTIEVRFTAKNNKTFYTNLSINKYSGYKTTEEFFIISVFDLTHYRMQAELIKESQLRFENIANSAPVMIWITDVDGLFIFVNNIWSIFSGRNIGEELGLNWIQDVHPDEINGLIDLYKKSVDTRTAFSYEFRFKRIDRVYRWLMMNGVPRSNDDGSFLGFIGTCTDITNQKENVEYINKINYELENANKNKDKFFSIISHDLRSPLSGIMSILEMIVADYGSLEENELRKILSEAARSSKNTFILMENLLEWARLQTGKMKFEPQNISLTLMLNAVKNLYYQKLKEKGISFIFDFTAEFFAFADPNMTETILRNLISNAIKFTKEFGLILVSIEILDDDILIKIKDTGVGMDENQISKLFKLEITHSSVGTSGEKGTGLGLILCKELVEKQNGKIWVQSEINLGSTFFFTFPKAK